MHWAHRRPQHRWQHLPTRKKKERQTRPILRCCKAYSISVTIYCAIFHIFYGNKSTAVKNDKKYSNTCDYSCFLTSPSYVSIQAQNTRELILFSFHKCVSLWKKFLLQGSHSFTCHPHVCPRTDESIPSLLRKHSPDGATPDRGSVHLIAAYYLFVDPEMMKGWVGLVGGLVAYSLST